MFDRPGKFLSLHENEESGLLQGVLLCGRKGQWAAGGVSQWRNSVVDQGKWTTCGTPKQMKASGDCAWTAANG
jgi:hypothetical protein